MQISESKQKLLEKLSKAIAEHKKAGDGVKKLREELKEKENEFEQSEENLKALQCVGQLVSHIIQPLPNGTFPRKLIQRNTPAVIVKVPYGPRYIVNACPAVKPELLKHGIRVTLDQTTMTIMKILPREVDPRIFSMVTNETSPIDYNSIGGLQEQIRQLREVIELPIKNPELFIRVGIKPPKGCLLYGPPGTGKTMLARVVASQIGDGECNFLRVSASGIVDKYIGESARIVREMFSYARDHQPCVIFIDEVDAIGGRRLSEGNSSDREIQRTLMELLGQLDGFDERQRVCIIMATNRPDTLDPALLRPGRLDRRIEIPLPNATARGEILKIHSMKMAHRGELNWDPVVVLSEGFNGADLRNVVTEAGMFAIRAERDFVQQEDLSNAVRKIADSKLQENKLDYKPV